MKTINKILKIKLCAESYHFYNDHFSWLKIDLWLKFSKSF